MRTALPEAPGGHNAVMAASLKGQLLIASPSIHDPNFRRTVVYMTEHGEEGAMGLILNRAMRGVLLLLAVQMAGTLTPLVLFPGETFTVFPIAPTLEGQYIIKNIVLIGAAMVVGATVRGGRLVAEPGDAARYAGQAGVAEGQTRPT